MNSSKKRDLFYLEDYLNKNSMQQDTTAPKKSVRNTVTVDKQARFERLCQDIIVHFNKEWESEEGRNSESADKLLEYQKNAIIGYTREVKYFQDKIKDYLKKNGLENEWYPQWYSDLVTAIFHENWGLAGIAEWKFNMPHSSSAKIIGEKIFFLINGKQVLQEQKISPDRFKQLRKAMLLRTPEKRFNEDYTEVYMLDGTRISIFDEPLAKEPTMIFRKYIIEKFSFEEQASRGTIPAECIPMLTAMAKIGYNVNFVGAVRTGKTTFYETWQSYEEPSLEGIQVETDPECALHMLLPNSPIIQLVADGGKLKGIVKSLLRGDADYLNMAESRDGTAINVAVAVANKGTRRVKGTFHTTNPTDFCFDAANEIVKEYGGDLYMTIIKVAQSFHYLFEFIQLSDKSKKRLKSIYEIRYNNVTMVISYVRIMKYDYKTDRWTFKYDIGEDKEQIAYEEDYAAFQIFRNELQKLAEMYPMEGEHVTVPYYSKLMRR